MSCWTTKALSTARPVLEGKSGAHKADEARALGAVVPLTSSSQAVCQPSGVAAARRAYCRDAEAVTGVGGKSVRVLFADGPLHGVDETDWPSWARQFSESLSAAKMVQTATLQTSKERANQVSWGTERKSPDMSVEHMVEHVLAGCDVEDEGGVAGHDCPLPFPSSVAVLRAEPLLAKAVPPPDEGGLAQCFWVELQRVARMCRCLSAMPRRRMASVLWAKTAVSR